MEENVIQINSGITINVDVSVKNVIYVKKIMLGILPKVVAEMENTVFSRYYGRFSDLL